MVANVGGYDEINPDEFPELSVSLGISPPKALPELTILETALVYGFRALSDPESRVAFLTLLERAATDGSIR